MEVYLAIACNISLWRLSYPSEGRPNELGQADNGPFLRVFRVCSGGVSGGSKV